MVAAEEHVGDIERSIRTVKECTQCHVHCLPYKRYPKAMIAGCIRNVINKLNQLPAENGISDELSPSTLITGEGRMDYNDVKDLEFGDYVQAYHNKGVTNTNNPRSVGAIALHASGNLQKGWYFMSLLTGERIHVYQWRELPISANVLTQVNQITLEEGQPVIATNFKYEWKPGTLIGDDVDDEDKNDENDDNGTHMREEQQEVQPQLFHIDDDVKDYQEEEEDVEYEPIEDYNEDEPV